MSSLCIIWLCLWVLTPLYQNRLQIYFYLIACSILFTDECKNVLSFGSACRHQTSRYEGNQIWFHGATCSLKTEPDDIFNNQLWLLEVVWPWNRTLSRDKKSCHWRLRTKILTHHHIIVRGALKDLVCVCVGGECTLAWLTVNCDGCQPCDP